MEEGEFLGQHHLALPLPLNDGLLHRPNIYLYVSVDKLSLKHIRVQRVQYQGPRKVTMYTKNVFIK